MRTKPWLITDVRIVSVDIAMREAFGIATGSKTAAHNCFVCITLSDGTIGWGEAAPFEAVNGEQREHVVHALEATVSSLLGYDLAAWRAFGPWLSDRITNCSSARCALETAALDALTRSMKISLSVLFGGAETELQCDLTVTTGSAQSARASAIAIAREGYRILKLKVGGVALEDDIARLNAVIDGASACGLILDGNGALTPDEAVKLAMVCRERSATIVLFEQPCDRNNMDAAVEVFQRTKINVCADESVATAKDVIELARHGAAQAINLKIMKSGILEAYSMATVARTLGLQLMIGGMVESTMAMSASAHLAAGFGGFSVVDLDTPLWLLDEPIAGGMRRTGPRLSIDHVTMGHGASLIESAR